MNIVYEKLRSAVLGSHQPLSPPEYYNFEEVGMKDESRSFIVLTNVDFIAKSRDDKNKKSKILYICASSMNGSPIENIEDHDTLVCMIPLFNEEEDTLEKTSEIVFTPVGHENVYFVYNHEKRIMTRISDDEYEGYLALYTS